jgi:hypothetical protein
MDAEADAQEGPDQHDDGEHAGAPKVGVTVTVLMMSAATSSSRPRGYSRPYQVTADVARAGASRRLLQRGWPTCLQSPEGPGFDVVVLTLVRSGGS